MELQSHFTGFYDAISNDQRMNCTHISLYMALLFHYIDQGTNPITVERNVLMQLAKISARSTYNKCMRDLHEYGYIRYTPSYNFYLRSMVHIKKI